MVGGDHPPAASTTASREPAVTRWLESSLFKVSETNVGPATTPGVIDWRATVRPVRPVEKRDRARSRSVRPNWRPAEPASLAGIVAAGRIAQRLFANLLQAGIQKR